MILQEPVRLERRDGADSFWALRDAAWSALAEPYNTVGLRDHLVRTRAKPAVYGCAAGPLRTHPLSCAPHVMARTHFGRCGMPLGAHLLSRTILLGCGTAWHASAELWAVRDSAD